MRALRSRASRELEIACVGGKGCLGDAGEGNGIAIKVGNDGGPGGVLGGEVEHRRQILSLGVGRSLAESSSVELQHLVDGSGGGIACDCVLAKMRGNT